MTAAPTTSLAVFEHALAVLQRHAGGMLRDPLSALLGIYLARKDVPAIGGPDSIGSGPLQDLLYVTFAKQAPFDLGAGPRAYLDGLTNVKLPAGHGNDWRNAFGTQKGLGSFGTPAELQQAAFRHPLRDHCPHRAFDAVTNEYFCQSSPNGTACKSRLQHAGEVTKALRCVPVSARSFSYQLAPADFADLEKLVPGPVKIPVLPVIAAIYGGAPRHIRRDRAVVTHDQLLADLGLSQADAAAIFDFNPAAQGNVEVIAMTEPYLLTAMRRQMHDEGFIVSLPDLINFHLSLKTRSFVILSGISGTGKSLLPRMYAAKVDPGVTPLGNLEVVPVRPGWNDLADLMGYYNAIHRGFEPGPALPAFAKAAQAADGHGDLPVLLVLDELNLARVEHYFADFLSVMESRRLEAGAWRTDPLRLVGSQVGLVNYVGMTATTPYVDSVEAQLELPDNLFVIGTINIDESTQGISNRVLDRANSIEFESVSLTTPAAPAAPQGYQTADLHLLAHSLTDRGYRRFSDVEAAHPGVVATLLVQLQALSDALEPFRLHFGMRTRDEIASYMAYAEDLIVSAGSNGLNVEGFDRDHAFDRQVLQKVLPRVAGTREELQHTTRGNLFDALTTILTPLNCTLSLAKVKRMRDQEIVNFWEA